MPLAARSGAGRRLALWADDVGIEAVGAEPVVAATLRELRSVSKASLRLPLSSALQSFEQQQQQQRALAAAATSVSDDYKEMRRELRSSDRALSDLRTELWQAQERARRLATEVWRMDGERSRLRAVQGQLSAEIWCVLSLLRLRAPLPAALPASDDSPSEWELELHALVNAACHLRSAVEEGGVLIETSVVEAERAAWQQERIELRSELESLQRAARARELRADAERDAEDARLQLIARAEERIRRAKETEAAARAAQAAAAAAAEAAEAQSAERIQRAKHAEDAAAAAEEKAMAAQRAAADTRAQAARAMEEA